MDDTGFNEDLSMTDVSDLETTLNSETQDDAKEQDSKTTMALDINSLIRNCVQGAAAMLKDSDENTHRTTARVQILMKLLSDNAKDYPGMYNTASWAIQACIIQLLGPSRHV